MSANISILTNDEFYSLSETWMCDCILKFEGGRVKVQNLYFICL